MYTAKSSFPWLKAITWFVLFSFLATSSSAAICAASNRTEWATIAPRTHIGEAQKELHRRKYKDAALVLLGRATPKEIARQISSKLGDNPEDLAGFLEALWESKTGRTKLEWSLELVTAEATSVQKNIWSQSLQYADIADAEWAELVSKLTRSLHEPMYSFSPFAVISLDSSREDEIILPENENVIFFEPHPDDCILSSCTLIEKLLKRHNKVTVVGIYSNSEATGEQAFWPPIGANRIRENRKAFEILRSKIKGQENAGTLEYVPYYLATNNEQDPRNQHYALEVLMREKADVVVIPSGMDTHQNHRQVNRVVKTALMEYATLRSMPVRVFEIPLFSATPKAFEDTQIALLQSDNDLVTRRKALDCFRSQAKYVKDAHYQQREKERDQTIRECVRNKGLDLEAGGELKTVIPRIEMIRDSVVFPRPAMNGRFRVGAAVREALQEIVTALNRELLSQQNEIVTILGKERGSVQNALFVWSSDIDQFIWLTRKPLGEADQKRFSDYIVRRLSKAGIVFSRKEQPVWESRTNYSPLVDTAAVFDNTSGQNAYSIGSRPMEFKASDYWNYKVMDKYEARIKAMVFLGEIAEKEEIRKLFNTVAYFPEPLRVALERLEDFFDYVRRESPSDRVRQLFRLLISLQPPVKSDEGAPEYAKPFFLPRDASLRNAILKDLQLLIKNDLVRVTEDGRCILVPIHITYPAFIWENPAIPVVGEPAQAALIERNLSDCDYNFTQQTSPLFCYEHYLKHLSRFRTPRVWGEIITAVGYPSAIVSWSAYEILRSTPSRDDFIRVLIEQAEAHAAIAVDDNLEGSSDDFVRSSCLRLLSERKDISPPLQQALLQRILQMDILRDPYAYSVRWAAGIFQNFRPADAALRKQAIEAWEKLLASSNPYNREHAARVLTYLRQTPPAERMDAATGCTFSLSVQSLPPAQRSVILNLNGKQHEFIFSGKDRNLEMERVLEDGRRISSDIELKDLSVAVLEELYARRDRQFRNHSQEQIRLAFEKTDADSILSPGVSLSDQNPSGIFALKTVYEALIRFREDQKDLGAIRHPDFRPDLDNAVEAAKPQKILIGIPTYRGRYDVSERIRNILDEIRHFPASWRHWEIEIAVWVNDDPDKMDDAANRVAASVPADLLYGIPMPITVKIHKEPRSGKANALHQMYGYARRTGATIVSFTDDDIAYLPGSLAKVFEATLSCSQPYLVGTRTFFQTKPLSELYRCRVREMRGARARAMAAAALDYVWQNMAAFSRRVDIPFAKPEILGASMTFRTSAYQGIPFWIRSDDMWLRYLHAPYLCQPAGAYTSTPVDENYWDYFRKRPRVVQGDQETSAVFSPARTEAQRDRDFPFRRKISPRGLKIRDRIWFYLSQTINTSATSLYHKFGHLFTDTYWYRQQAIPAAGEKSPSHADGWNEITFSSRGMVFDGNGGGVSTQQIDQWLAAAGIIQPSTIHRWADFLEEEFWRDFNPTRQIPRQTVERLVRLALREEERNGVSQAFKKIIHIISILNTVPGPNQRTLGFELFRTVLDLYTAAPQGGWMKRYFEKLHVRSTSELVAWANAPPQTIQDPQKIRKIAVLSRVTSGADIAITSILVQRLRKSCPNAQITFIGDNPANFLLMHGAGANRFRHQAKHKTSNITTYFSSWKELVDLAGVENYDLIVDPSSRFTQAGLLPLTPLPAQNHLVFQDNVYPNGKILSNGELVNRWMDGVLKEQRTVFPAVALETADVSSARESLMRYFQSDQAPCIALAMAGNLLKKSDKMLSIEEELHLASELIRSGKKVILVKAPGMEGVRTDRLVELLRAKGLRISPIAAGPENAGKIREPCDGVVIEGAIRDISPLLKNADLLISCDSMAAHLGSALGIRTLVIYTSPEGSPDRWIPFAPQRQVFGLVVEGVPHTKGTTVKRERLIREVLFQAQKLVQKYHNREFSLTLQVLDDSVEGITMASDILAPALQDRLLPSLRNGAVVMDITAGAGFHTVYMSKYSQVHSRDFTVFSCDLNPKAAETVRENLAINNAAENTHVFSGDLYAPFLSYRRQSGSPQAGVDLIVGTPPIMPVYRHEIPSEGLGPSDYANFDYAFASGDAEYSDGLGLVRRILSEGFPLLNPGGRIALYLSDFWGDEMVRRVFEQAGYTSFEVLGQKPRFVSPEGYTGIGYTWSHMELIERISGLHFQDENGTPFASVAEAKKSGKKVFHAAKIFVAAKPAPSAITAHPSAQDERFEIMLARLDKKDPKAAAVLKERCKLMDPRDEDAMRDLLQHAEWFLNNDIGKDGTYYKPRDKDNPKVTIVLLHYGSSPEMTINALKHLEHITYRNYDIILVDNNSPDGFSQRYESELVAQIPDDVRKRIRLVRNKANLGYTGGNNQAAAMALASGSDYVFYFNNDALMDSDGLQKLVDAVKYRPEIGAIQPHVHNYNEDQREQVVDSLKRTGKLPESLREEARVRAKEWLDKAVQDGWAYQVADHLYYKEPIIWGTVQLVRSDMLRLAGGFDTRLFMYDDEADIGYRYAITGLKKAVLSDAYAMHPPWESLKELRAHNLIWRNYMFLPQQFYHATWGETGRTIAMGKTIRQCFFNPNVKLVQEELDDKLSGKDPLMFIAVFKGICDGLLDHYVPTQEALVDKPGETEQIQAYAETFSNMTSPTNILRMLFDETDAYQIRLMLYGLHSARNKIRFTQNLDPSLCRQLKSTLEAAVQKWKAWVETEARDPMQITHIRGEFRRKVTKLLFPTASGVRSDGAILPSVCDTSA